MLVLTYDAYVLVDTGAMHAYISEEFMLVCGLVPKIVNDYMMFVNTPLHSGSILNKICMNADVVIYAIHMLIDMLVLPIFNFNDVLGMNRLNKY